MKGALVGMACAQAAAVVIQFVLRQIFVGPGPIFTARPWVQTLFSLAGMLTPLGIVIGGIVGRSRLR